MSRASLDKQPHEVAAMFDAVARRYDVTNTVLSFGQVGSWRRATRQALRLRPGDRVLDLAAGTGASTADLARSGATAVGCDFSLGMLRAGRSRAVPLVAGDALRLPFPDATFDAATISFGLRNVADVDRALRELARVTRPGGRLVVCEFSRPTWTPFRTGYVEYLMRALPVLARRVSSNPDAYVYLAESIRAWPDQPALAARIAAAGWADVGWRNLTGGVVALHRARRPGGCGVDGPGTWAAAAPGRRSDLVGGTDELGGGTGRAGANHLETGTPGATDTLGTAGATGATGAVGRAGVAGATAAAGRGGRAGRVGLAGPPPGVSTLPPFSAVNPALPGEPPAVPVFEPGEPPVAGSEPSGPGPTQPAPSPAEPSPAEPSPAEPSPAEPSPAEPGPAEPSTPLFPDEPATPLTPTEPPTPLNPGT